MAAKCMILHPDDGIVTQVPALAEPDALAEPMPGAIVVFEFEPVHEECAAST